MKVPYSQMMGFIVTGYKPLYIHMFNQELTFTFEDYVKSQLHLQVVPDLYGRDIFQYHKALKYLRGEDRYLLDCSTVLRYFYEDMTNMLCNLLKSRPGENTKIDIEVNINRPTPIPRKEVVLSDVVKELEEALNGDPESSSSLYSDGIFVKFDYNELDDISAGDLLALASIFLYYGSNSEETYVVEVK